MNQNLSNFFLCGSAGWCLEILWTGLHSLLAGQRTMNGKTSVLQLSHRCMPEFTRFLFSAGDCFICSVFILWNLSVEVF
mgnify:CR=1 FL=1